VILSFSTHDDTLPHFSVGWDNFDHVLTDKLSQDSSNGDFPADHDEILCLAL
jgi:hypothetical protein